MARNEELEKQNVELCHNLHREKEACVKLRVQIKILESKKKDGGESGQLTQPEKLDKEE